MDKKISIQVFSNSLGDEELNALKPIFQSKWIGMGAQTKKFEEEFGDRLGTTRVLSVNCCTSALFLSIKILGIGRGDEVIIPTVNFIGASNAICEVGAKPVFADVDLATLNIMPSEIKRLRTSKTKAVLLLHYGGHPCDMDAIKEASEGLFIIEDSANSIVSTYKGKHCGTIGDAGCFSFDAMKILSVGDCGALIVNNEALYNKAREYRYLGISNQQTGIDSFKAKHSRWWEINLNCTSGRYITNDIMTAIAREQLKKLDGFIKQRKSVWERYQKELKGLDWLTLPPEPIHGATSSYYLYWIKCRDSLRDQLAEYLVNHGIYCTFRYYPLHLIEQYGATEALANAEELNNTVLNIPLHQNLSDDEVSFIIEKIKCFKSFINKNAHA